MHYLPFLFLSFRCILDGEMLVWDTSLNRFAEFGSNQEIGLALNQYPYVEKSLVFLAVDVIPFVFSSQRRQQGRVLTAINRFICEVTLVCFNC